MTEAWRRSGEEPTKVRTWAHTESIVDVPYGEIVRVHFKTGDHMVVRVFGLMETKQPNNQAITAVTEFGDKLSLGAGTAISRLPWFTKNPNSL